MKRVTVRMKCTHCGGENVRCDAWAEWDSDSGQWELSEVYDHSWCLDCDGETNIVREEIP